MLFADRHLCLPRFLTSRVLRTWGLCLGLFFVLSGAPALAVHDTGLFELDGNTAAATDDDFDTIFSGPGGSLDHAFVGDTSTPDPTDHGGANDDRDPINTWECESSSPSGIRNLTHTYTALYRMSGDLHLFFGADRGAATGAQWWGLWLLQQPVACDSAGDGKFSGQQVDGDLFIVGSFDVSGATLVTTVYRWTDPDLDPSTDDGFLGDGTTEGTALVSGTDCTLADPHATSPNICAVINTGDITPAWEASALVTKRFFEAGINLSAIFGMSAFPQPVCYRNFLMETRGGAALSATQFDYAIGDLETCGSITVDAVANPASDPQAFDFTVAGGPNSTNDAFQLAGATPPHTTFDLSPGNYTVTETLPATWDLASATCTGGPFGAGAPYTNGAAMTLGFADHVSCVFTNERRGARIIVDKVTAPGGDPQLFSYSLTGGPDSTNEQFQVADGTAPHVNVGLVPGTYNLSESALAGWDAGTITCVGGPFGTGGGSYTNGGPITVTWGDVVTCTFPSSKRGSITVDKVTGPALDPQSFDFSVAGGPDSIVDNFALSDTAVPHTSANLRPGSYTVTETVPTGWDFTTATCVGGSFGAGQTITNGGTVNLTAGAQVTCTFTNLRRARVIVDKVTNPAADPRVFKFILSGKAVGSKKSFRAQFELSDQSAPFSIEIKPGTYRILERGARGWKRTNTTCVGGPFGAGMAYDKAKFTLAPTEVVTCTYTNTKE